MPIIEIRRHAKRRKPGANLTTEGICRAQQASACQRDYALVVTSTVPRAVQTAVAMGHGVDEEEPQLSSMGIALERFPWDSDFGAMQRAIQSDPAARAYAELHAAHLRAWMERVGRDSDVLVISHGGVAELGIIGVLGDGVDVSSFGPALDYCEGVRMAFDADELRRVEVMRFIDEVERRDVTIEVRAEDGV